MAFVSRQRSTLPGIALALVLVAAQYLTAMHDLQHDSGAAQSQVCTTCVAASQLGAAAVDIGSVPTTTATFNVFNTAIAAPFYSSENLAPRPRGPPARF